MTTDSPFASSRMISAAVQRSIAAGSPVIEESPEITFGARIAVARFGGRQQVGTVTAVGPWIESCAGSPMRWIEFTDAEASAHHTVAHTRHNDFDIRLIPA